MGRFIATTCLDGMFSAYVRIGLETRNCVATALIMAQDCPHRARLERKKGETARGGTCHVLGVVIPYPKLKPLDRVREVLWVSSYACAAAGRQRGEELAACPHGRKGRRVFR